MAGCDKIGSRIPSMKDAMNLFGQLISLALLSCAALYPCPALFLKLPDVFQRTFVSGFVSSFSDTWHDDNVL